MKGEGVSSKPLVLFAEEVESVHGKGQGEARSLIPVLVTGIQQRHVYGARDP